MRWGGSNVLGVASVWVVHPGNVDFGLLDPEVVYSAKGQLAAEGGAGVDGGVPVIMIMQSGAEMMVSVLSRAGDPERSER